MPVGRTAFPIRCALFATLLLSSVAHAQSPRPEFWVPNDLVTLAAISGNTLYIGGKFTHIGPRNTGLTKVDSVTAASLPVPELLGYIIALVPDGAGGWYVGGNFKSIQGVPRNNLAHLDAGGAVTAWNPGADSTVSSLERRGDTLYAAGSFRSIAGVPRRFMASIDINTAAATSFDPSPNVAPGQIIVTPTLVFVRGFFDTIGAQRRPHVASVDRITGVTQAFGVGLGTGGYASAMQLGNGKVYLGGNFHFGSIYHVCAFDSVTGNPSWSSNSCDNPVSSLVLDHGLLYAGGTFTFIGGAFRTSLARLNASNGTCDQSWFADWSGDPEHLALSGNVLYVATATPAGGATARAIDVSTGLPTSWAPVVSTPPAFVVAPASVFLIGPSVGGADRNFAAAFDLTTGALTAWNPLAGQGPLTRFRALAVRGNVAYLGGSFGVYARDATTGTSILWSQNISGSGNVETLALANDTLYAGGSFSSIGGQSRNGLAAFALSNGAVGPWNPGGGSVLALSLVGSTLYAGGTFPSLGGVARAGLGAVSTATGVATSWNPSAAPAAYSQLFATPSRVFVSGGFTAVGGSSRNGLAVLDATTGSALAFDATSDGSVNEISPTGNALYAIGGFTHIGGGTHVNIACLDGATGSANGFDPKIGGTFAPDINALASAPGTVVIGGLFDQVAGRNWQNLVVLRDPQIAIGDRVRAEGNGGTVGWKLNVTLSPASTEIVTVDWATADGTATAVTGDYAVGSGTVTFLPGETSKTISVGIVGDPTPEPSESLLVQLSNPVHATIADARGVITLADDDADDFVCRNLWTTDGAVNAMLPDGNTLYLGGTFTRVGKPTGGGVPIDASTGLALATPRANGSVFAAISDGAGGWFVGGDFTHVDGTPRGRVAWLKSDGSLMPWDPGANGAVRALLLVGSTLYVGGDFTAMDGAPRGGGAAFDIASGPMTAWNPATDASVCAITERSGVIYAGGTFGFAGGQQRQGLAAVDVASGTVAGWNPNVGRVNALVADANALYAGGGFSGIGGVGRRFAARIHPATGLPLSFNPSPNASVQGLALSGSRLFLAGSFDSLGTTARRSLASVDTATGAVSAWNPNPDLASNAVAVSGATVYAGGVFSTVGGTPRGGLAAIDANTAALLPWNPNAGGAVNALAVSGSTVFAGGGFHFLAPATRNRVAAIDLTTGAVLPFDPNADGTVYALAKSGSTLFVGGAFVNLSLNLRMRLAALDTSTPAGSLLAFNPTANNTVMALTVSGTTLYAGGAFTKIGSGGGGPNRRALAAWDVTTGTLGPWNPNALDTVYTIVVNGSTLYAGGAFGTIGGQARPHIAAIDVTSGLPSAWNPNADFTVRTLALGQGVIYAGGTFGTIGGLSRNRVAALSLASGNATAWNPNADGAVTALAASGNRVALGGSFTALGANARRSYAVADTGTAAALTATDPQVLGDVNAIVFNASTNVVAGSFTRAGNLPFASLACVDPASTVAVEPSVGRGVFDLLRLSPNPARAAAAIEFELPTAAHVKIDVFDVAGRHVVRLADSDREAGRHRVVWETAPRLDPGVYLVRLETAGRTLRRSLVVLR